MAQSARHAVETAEPILRDQRARDGTIRRTGLSGVSSGGADDRFDPDERDRYEFEPGPISGCQHDLADAEARTDAATTYHGLDEPA